MEEAIRIIEEELQRRGIKVLKIILFGSRAKGTHKDYSDWDFFVIINKKISFTEKWNIIDDIKIRLAKLSIPNDIILKSQEDVEEAKDDVGRITYYVLKEGIEL
jgi:predicted nucleotidyltransferase